MSYSARHKRSAGDRHAGKHDAGRRHGRDFLRRDRTETDPAEMPPDQDVHTPQYLGAPAEE